MVRGIFATPLQKVIHGVMYEGIHSTRDVFAHKISTLIIHTFC